MLPKTNLGYFWLILLFLIIMPFTIPAYAVGGHPENEPREFHVKPGENLDDQLYLFDMRYDRPYEGETSYWDSGILLTRIGEIDREVGSYEADFWLWVEVHEEDDPTDFTVNPPAFNFINGRHIEFDSESIEPKYWEVKVRGEFFNEMDFRKFPFETLDLRIEIEPETKERTIDKVRFVLDPVAGIDKTAKVPGWETGEFKLAVSDYHYDDDPDSEYVWSRYAADFFVERSTVGSLVKNVLPVSLITGLSLLIFFIPENYTPRIYLTAPLLLSLVYLHQGALHEIPPVGYMTIFDKIMVINFSLFVNAILSLAIQMKLHTEGKTVLVKKMNNVMRLFIPIIIAIGVLFIITTM